jgi:uncharacterized protein YdhG (YjbR/CyaY superfamily)
MNATPTDIDAYLATVPDPARATLVGIRRSVKALAPEAEESISYGMPTFKYRGRPLVYFAAWKDHCSLYGLDVDAFKQELAGYEVARGTIRFPADRPLPAALLRTIIEARMAAIEAAAPRRSASANQAPPEP